MCRVKGTWRRSVSEVWMGNVVVAMAPETSHDGWFDHP